MVFVYLYKDGCEMFVDEHQGPPHEDVVAIADLGDESDLAYDNIGCPMHDLSNGTSSPDSWVLTPPPLLSTPSPPLVEEEAYRVSIPPPPRDLPSPPLVLRVPAGAASRDHSDAVSPPPQSLSHFLPVHVQGDIPDLLAENLPRLSPLHVPDDIPELLEESSPVLSPVSDTQWKVLPPYDPRRELLSPPRLSPVFDPRQEIMPPFDPQRELLSPPRLSPVHKIPAYDPRRELLSPPQLSPVYDPRQEIVPDFDPQRELWSPPRLSPFYNPQRELWSPPRLSPFYNPQRELWSPPRLSPFYNPRQELLPHHGQHRELQRALSPDDDSSQGKHSPSLTPVYDLSSVDGSSQEQQSPPNLSASTPSPYEEMLSPLLRPQRSPLSPDTPSPYEEMLSPLLRPQRSLLSPSTPSPYEEMLSPLLRPHGSPLSPDTPSPYEEMLSPLLRPQRSLLSPDTPSPYEEMLSPLLRPQRSLLSPDTPSPYEEMLSPLLRPQRSLLSPDTPSPYEEMLSPLLRPQRSLLSPDTPSPYEEMLSPLLRPQRSPLSPDTLSPYEEMLSPLLRPRRSPLSSLSTIGEKLFPKARALKPRPLAAAAAPPPPKECQPTISELDNVVSTLSDWQQPIQNAQSTESLVQEGVSFEQGFPDDFSWASEDSTSSPSQEASSVSSSAHPINISPTTPSPKFKTPAYFMRPLPASRKYQIGRKNKSLKKQDSPLNLSPHSLSSGYAHGSSSHDGYESLPSSSNPKNGSPLPLPEEPRVNDDHVGSVDQEVPVLLTSLWVDDTEHRVGVPRAWLGSS